MIAFRVDANEQIATGHLMRCLAMAAELKRRGEQCVFFLAEEKETERILAQGVPYEVLESRWDLMEEELPKLGSLLEKYSPDWVVVDSYQVTKEYLRKLNEKVQVLYVDDMAQEIWPVSMVLHYSDWLEDDAYQKRYEGSGTRVLCGMKYIPLRAEFYPGGQRPEGSVLITTGGTDAYNVAGELLESIFDEKCLSLEDSSFPIEETINDIFTKEKQDFQEKDRIEGRKKKLVDLRTLTYHVIVGSMNQYKEKLQKLEQEYSNIILHYNVDNMGTLMRSSDAAVSAGGTTLFELCACQIPTVCFSFADNQEEFAKKMGEKQVMLYAGDPRYGKEALLKNLAESLQHVMENPDLRKTMKKNMGTLTDGRGTERIAEALLYV